MRAHRVHPLLAVTLLVVGATLAVACGDDTPSTNGATTDATTAPATSTPATTTPATTTPATTTPATTVVPTTVVPTTVPTTSAAPATTLPDAPVVLEQAAVWPAADVVFTTPEAAAEDFVAQVLGPGPTLGEFRAGDSRSGEMVLSSPGEGANPVAVERGLLLLRQLGPSSGWFVLAVANDEASITAPEQGAVVPPAPLTVEGIGHGFEANLVARAIVAGDAQAVLDLQITMAGSMEEAGPYSVTLDLSAANPGATIMILVRTGAGLETDPGEVGAIAVTVS